MTPMDIFDTLLESIQQFPLECNNFERQTKRLTKDQDKYTKIFEKLSFKLVSPQDKKILKTRRRLTKTLKKKLKITNNFHDFVNKHLERLQKLISISSIDPSILNIHPIKGIGPSTIKVSDIPVGKKKYCLCGERAYGMMICCDNPGCITKWFHFRCVNIHSPPKSMWKCPNCLNPDV